MKRQKGGVLLYATKDATGTQDEPLNEIGSLKEMLSTIEKIHANNKNFRLRFVSGDPESVGVPHKLFQEAVRMSGSGLNLNPENILLEETKYDLTQNGVKSLTLPVKPFVPELLVVCATGDAIDAYFGKGYEPILATGHHIFV